MRHATCISTGRTNHEGTDDDRNATRSEGPVSGTSVPEAAAGTARHRGRAEAEGRPWRGDVRGRRPPDGPRGARHRRRLGHRQGGGHRLRARGRRRSRVLPGRRGGGRCSRHGRVGRASGASRGDDRGRHPGSGRLRLAGGARGFRAGPSRHPRQQCRLAGLRRPDRGRDDRRVAAHLPHQHRGHVPLV